MTMWVLMILLSLVALAFVIWPLYRSSARLTPVMAAAIVVTVGLSATMYHYIGDPNVPSGAGSTPPAEDMVVALAERLEDNPEDINGWLMLARSYQTMQQYDEAISAFEKAVELEKGQNAQTLVSLAIALMGQQSGELSERASSLIENALALEPNNANALFYGGGAAARRGNTALAADRWEMLLSQNAPPEIQGLLQRKINEWRGLPPPSMPLEAQPEDNSSIVSINLSVSEDAKSALPQGARVYVIARDPAQPSPPIAVVPLRLSDLPNVVSLGDKNSMVAGRLLSSFFEFEIVARVSRTGSPSAQSGDWSGSLLASPNDGHTIDLVIDQEIP
jgi:cytochrome c-type biogenesis protein CcmH